MHPIFIAELVVKGVGSCFVLIVHGLLFFSRNPNFRTLFFYQLYVSGTRVELCRTLE